MAFGPKPKLSLAQQAVAKELCAKGWSYRQVAVKMGVGPNIIYRLCDPRYYQRMGKAYAKRAGELKSLERRGPVKRRAISQDVIDDRDHRLELQRKQSITAQMFGDPVPGRSALDQKQHAQRPVLQIQGMAESQG